MCNPQGRHIYKCDIVKEFKWEKVGVFRLGPHSNEIVEIDRKKIEGKLLKVDNLLMTCPNNVLNEQ